MFTSEQIQAAHSKVKTGADFPTYIQDLRQLGVTNYEAYVTDGHINYHGVNNHTAFVQAKYSPIVIGDIVNVHGFKNTLIEHQNGKSDFLTFINLCASYGIEKWVASLELMTCSYYDKSGNKILTEQIKQ